MKFHELANGNWLLRVRINQCHLFHGSDRINLGFKRTEIEGTKIKIYLKLKERGPSKVAACPSHSAKFNSKVRNVIYEP